jgi:hypothetical protein
MTGPQSLEEIFHCAVVAYVQWTKSNDRFQQYPNLLNEHGERRYRSEPRIDFGGRSLLLSEACSYFTTLKGPLPPHLAALFNNVIMWGFCLPDIEVSTYSEAVSSLRDMIEFEDERQDYDSILPMPGGMRA